MWLPLAVTVPFSLVYRYAVPRVFTTTVSWGFVIGMNIPSLVYVAYNLRQGRLVPFNELPRQAWVIALIVVIAAATINYALGLK